MEDKINARPITRATGLPPQLFEQAVAETKLGHIGREMARDVLVAGVGYAETARRHGGTRQHAQYAADRVRRVLLRERTCPICGGARHDNMGQPIGTEIRQHDDADQQPGERIADAAE